MPQFSTMYLFKLIKKDMLCTCVYSSVICNESRYSNNSTAHRYVDTENAG